jgi:diguanylate cyclase (GGDEF)-like protein
MSGSVVENQYTNRKHSGGIRDWWARLAMLAVLTWVVGSGQALAQSQGGADLTAQAHYWVDTSGQSTIDAVSTMGQEVFQPMEKPRSFKLQDSALWMRVELPPLDPSQRWYLSLDASSFTDLVAFYQADTASVWQEQRAGDHIAVDQWSIPGRAPLFAIDLTATPSSVWLRMENSPTPLSPRLNLLSETELEVKRHWVILMIGGYLGFGLLVMFLGWVHARLYADRAFVAYVVYVASMLGFQVSFTGLGGMFFWGQWAWWNNAAPAVFMLWLTASGIWFVREACSISRHHRGADRAVIGWSLFGLAFSLVYSLAASELTFLILSLYGLLSVILSITLCLWAWRQGERYAGWLLIGFLPVHLGYPFPALRSAGLLPDSWATQYAVLIGSAIEIPLLLYILHRRAKDFNENRTRVRALDSTDPLTGLTIAPVLHLRLRDAMRRARRYGHACGLLLVDVANYGEIVALEGREGGDRALVVAASKLTRVVRDVDTVCRVANTRFAVLIEGPVQSNQLKLLAQHLVAKGLEHTSALPGDTGLRFRMVTAMLPLTADAPNEAETEDKQEQHILKFLDKSLDQLATDARKSVLHLPQNFAEGQGPVATAA